MLRFLLKFAAILPVSILVEWALTSIIQDKLLGFLFLHLPLAYFCTDFKNLSWLALTILHGAAHIIHPAFNALTPNPNYTPFYDFIVHTVQCLTVYFYNKRLMPVGILFGAGILYAGITAHYDRSFMATTMWLALSSAGVFGSLYHMMLLNGNKDANVHKASMLIWTLPYLGYLIPANIPIWDYFVNTIGLFKVWYFNYFVTHKLYMHFKKIEDKTN